MYPMHPEMSRTLIEQRHQDIARQAAESRRGPVRRFPRWHLSLSKMTVPVIIITAHRPA
jgi:hypothetical protein